MIPLLLSLVLYMATQLIPDGTEVRTFLGVLRYTVIFHHEDAAGKGWYRVHQYQLDLDGNRCDEAELDVPADYLEQHYRESRRERQ